MNTHSRFRLSRRSSRYAPIVARIIVSLCILGIGAVMWGSVMPDTPYRQPIVISGDPVRIVSLLPDSPRVTVLEIPASASIVSVMGYGTYTLESLDALDRIDRHGGTLYRQSVADAFGIPVYWYVSGAYDAHGTAAGTLAALRSVFTWKSVLSAFTLRQHTTMSPMTWMKFVYRVQSLRPDAVETIQSSGILAPTQVADGSESAIVDENKLDYLLGQSFADPGLRNENMTVAVYNATTVPSVGIRASRMISRMGIRIVFVGNAQPSDSKQCRIGGSQSARKSRTAGFIRSYFHCAEDSGQDRPIGTESGADLVVTLSEDFAAIYRK